MAPSAQDINRVLEVGTAEVVVEDELRTLLTERSDLLSYIGFEPSGMAHVGWAITTQKLRHLQACGVKVIVLLADWHAYINDKLGGDLERIKRCGVYMEECFKALGLEPSLTEFVYASDYIGDADYWESVIRIGKAASLSRVRRALTIMGRKEEEAEQDSAKLLYPLMQAADIFHLKIDIALGGMDQRKAHMLMRDVASKLGKPAAVAIHTPLLASLKGGHGRMDPIDLKMSKSDPTSALYLHDDEAAIASKLSKAYCPAKDADGNPVLQLAQFLILPNNGSLDISRPERFGGDVSYTSYPDLEAAFVAGDLHPKDLKDSVAAAMAQLLAPVHAHFNSGAPADLLAEVQQFSVTR